MRRTLTLFCLSSLLFTTAALSAAPAGDAAEIASRLALEPTPPVRSADSPAIAKALVESLSPEELERRVTEQLPLVPGVFGTLAEALVRGNDDLAERVGSYLNAVTRQRGQRLASRPEGFEQDDVDLLLALQLVDLGRFVEDPDFRQKVLGLLPGALDPASPPELRERLLYRFNQLRGVDFEALENVAWAWGAVPRKSSDRELDNSVEISLGDTQRPIQASVYSLPSDFFTVADAVRFLTGVRRAAPERALLVLTDQPVYAALAAQGLDVRLVETWGFPFTPWPRDPLSFLRAEDGRRVALLRPPSARQGRPEDSWLGRALVQGLPEDLDAAWKLHWKRSSFPFHNGQILDTSERLWVTLHSLEIRILEILDLARVPVDRFGSQLGTRYVETAHQAAEELGEIYGREVVFVHALPSADDDPATRAAALYELGGGAGFDLDSFLTLLPTADGGLAALVADPGAGERLIDAASLDELDRFAATYGLALKGEALRKRLAAAQLAPRPRHLARFLDLVAGHLEGQAKVRRLPLLLVSRDLLRDRAGAGDPDFLIGWNNVVLELAGETRRAEGFASLLESGDELAIRIFTEEGYHLDLYSPLVKSVVANGGYRCASQHVR